MGVDIVGRVKLDLPVVACCTPLTSELTEREAAELASLFGTLADPNRVRILSMLLQASAPCCVCDLEPQLGVAQPTVSYHLKKLLDVGLLERERRGTFAYYRVAPESTERLRALFA